MKGMNVGYVRVSSIDQNTVRQLDGVELDRVFTDKCSGATTDRPALKEALAFVRQGDCLVVHSMDRLSRSLTDLKALVEELTKRGVTVKFMKEALTFGTEDSPMANLMLNLLGAVSEYERSLIKERVREGVHQAKLRGVYKGRKPKLSDAQAVELRQRIAAGEKKSELAREYGMSRESVYNYLR